MTIGERIKNKRIEKDLSQAELAKLAGYYDKTVISRFEHAGNDISMKQVKRIAKALNVSPAYLMGWEVPSNESKIMMIGDNAKSLPVFAEGEDIEKALELYKAYSVANPDVQAAVEILLKPQSPDS